MKKCFILLAFLTTLISNPLYNIGFILRAKAEIRDLIAGNFALARTKQDIEKKNLILTMSARGRFSPIAIFFIMQTIKCE